MSGNELQDEYVEPVENEFQEEITEETEADLAPASEQVETKPKVEFTPEQQEVFNRELAKKTFKLREEERKRLQVEQELQAIREKQNAVSTAPVVPDIPDPFDPDYDKKVVARDEAIKQRAAHDAHLAYLAQQENIAQQRKIEQDQARYQQVAQDYSKKAVALGVSPQELQYAGQGVAAYLSSPELIEEILTDEMGPLITTYLAANVAELEELSLMRPIQAARYIEAKIKPKLSARKPRISNAPEPVQKLSGNAPQGSSYFKHSKGAKFE